MTINNIYKHFEELKNEKDFIDLTDSNFARPEFFKPTYKILEPLIIDYLKKREYKPDPNGDILSRKAICDYYLKRNYDTSSDNITITASTSEAYNILLQTFSKIGDVGMIPNPGYPLFEYLFKLNKIESAFYYLKFNNNWRFNLSAIKKSITPHTRFLILISPNNPTGSIISQQDLDDIIKLCQLNKIFLIIDEVFIPFTDDHYSLPDKAIISTPIFILNGISKMFGLPDFKLGWILVYGKNSEFYVDKLGTTNDVYLSATTLTQRLLPDLFKNIGSIQQPIIDRLKINREYINEFFIKNINIFLFNKCLGGIHTFFGLKTKSLTEEQFVIKLLQQKHVFIHPGYFYDYQNDNLLWFSFSYLLPLPQLKIALNRLLEFSKSIL